MQKRKNSFVVYIIRRLLAGIPLVLMVVILCFVLIQIMPGDPVSTLAAGYDISDELRESIEQQWGLNEPFVIQLLTYMGRMLSGNLGDSYFQGRSVAGIIFDRVPATLLLMGTAILFSAVIGILVGTISARKMHSRLDSCIMAFSLIGYSAPLFWIGQLMVIIFAINLNIFPTSGMHSLRVSAEGFAYVLDVAKHLVMPALTLSFWFTALMVRTTRTKMAETLQADYIKTARAKGLKEGTVVRRHALRNATPPIITVFGIEFSVVFMGAVVVETVFSWPGTGRLMYDAVMMRDYPLITGIFFIISISVILVNIIVDILYAVFDPRIRYR